ncbi:MATE family efflux transporter [Xylanibacter muris]|uniref:Multidrug-efflux transporter n=1 Tax=Xylanibacter muris TaxID=2736290 RepID=A0ABX2AKV5_9BACT|nr:MATE family efflux transporter [Xylanibacter muris]NPD91202.1 MATE family efflux transporter [Xylanibacter muris]
MPLNNKESELLDYIREGREMTRGQRLRLIIQLSIPSILSQMSAIMMFFIDASMVGSLGERQAASVGLVESTTWLFGGLTSAASMGFSVQVAHFIGANDFDAARRVLRQGIVCTLIFSSVISLTAFLIHSRLPFWLGGGEDIAHDASMYFLVFSMAVPLLQLSSLSASMLKCSGNMKIPSMLNILMCILDVVFNYILIFVVGLGVMGAAMGTLLALLTTASLMFYFLVYRSRHLSISRHGGSFIPTSDCVRTALRIGAPMGLQQILMGGAQIVSTAIVAPLGNISIAANTFAITVESICYMPGYGIAEAATTLVGQGLGAGQKVLTRSFAHLSVMLGVVVMTVMAVLMYVFSYGLISVMTPVEAIRELGSAVLRIEAFAEPMFAAAIVCYGVFVGAGDTVKPAAMNLVSMWAVRLSLAAALAPAYGLKGVWTAMAVELTFRGVIFIYRLLRGNWADGIMADKKK